MAWTLETDYAPVTEHTGYVQMLLDDGTATSTWSREIAERVTGWQAGCECGTWTSMRSYDRADHPSPNGTEPSQVEEWLSCAWEEHVLIDVPELRLHTLAARRSGTAAAVDAEVQTLRVRGVPWERIGAAVGMTRQSAWERWRHLDLVERKRTGADTRPAATSFRPALDELDALAGPHAARADVDPAVTAVEQAAIGLRRLLAPTGPEDTDDAVARLDRAADYAREVHANMLGSVGAVATAAITDASLEAVQVDYASLRVYDEDDGKHTTLDVTWGGASDEPPVLRVGGRTVTDPVEVLRITRALEILSATAANTLYPANDDVPTA
ncbi:hypothetical protein ACIRPH_31595 [Nocardiopsis sp. NPDC101807]|uniref:hypothetical protein n=1 Tax=Nocardiopsis sp. NPDC101807 TaxID=3364339 RepID=UPI0038019708